MHIHILGICGTFMGGIAATAHDFHWSEELVTYDFYKMGLPDADPARQAFWTDIYLDAGGKGLMATIGQPVYDAAGQFRGTMNLDLTRKTILFMSLDNCRFRYPVRPGAVLRMPVDVLRARPEVARFKGRALVNDSLAAEVEFMAMVVERT